MKAYLYDDITKEFVSEVEAQIDHLETKLKGEKIYLLPANASFTPPLENKNGFKVVFNGNEWVYEEIPEPEILPEPILTYSELRERAYPSIQEQLDMLYWDTVNGTNNWMDKITEIKNKYPKGE